MDLLYEKAIAEHKLNISDLPEDAKIAIADIKKVQNSFKMIEKKGKKVSPATMNRLKALDKWAYYEILDHIQGTDKNSDEPESDAEEIIAAAESDANKTPAQNANDKPGDKPSDTPAIDPKDELGIKIDNELDALNESGKLELTVDELKSTAKNAYAAVFKSYKAGEENGLETSNFSLIETGDKIFTLTKK